MKKAVIIQVLLFLGSSVYCHELNMAIFEIVHDEKGYEVNISFDKTKLERSLMTTYPELSHRSGRNVWNKYLRKYLNGNFQLIINEECAEMYIHTIHYDLDYIRLGVRLSTPNVPVQVINVFNTCLIDYHRSHSNLIKTNVFGKARAFRLTNERITTTIE